jgi:hypothetical protein
MIRIYYKDRYHPNNPDNDHAYNNGFDTQRVFINILQTDPVYREDYNQLKRLARRFIEEHCIDHLNHFNDPIVDTFAGSSRTVDDLIWIVYNRVARHRFN